MTPETIYWHSVEHLLPDDGEMVLTYSPGSSDVVWVGYYVGDHTSTMTGKQVGTWFRVYGEDHRKLIVNAWAKLPSGAGIL